jgi:hypothetical protein
MYGRRRIADGDSVMDARKGGVSSVVFGGRAGEASLKDGLFGGRENQNCRSDRPRDHTGSYVKYPIPTRDAQNERIE